MPTAGGCQNRRVDIEPGRHVFVGRGRELAVLRAGMMAARKGRGGAILVSGPAGIGKSHLVAEAVAGATGVVRGRCLTDGGAPPLWPWLRIVGRIPADLVPAEITGAADAALAVDASESAAARFRLLVRLCDGLVSAAEASGGLVVVIEDLHDADEASLALLRHLVREVADSWLLIIGTHRDATGGPAAGLAASLAEIARSAAVQTIALASLDASEVAEYLADCGADSSLAGPLHERTGGLPLLVATVTRILAQTEPLPGSGGALPSLPAPDLTVLVSALLGGLDPAVRDSAEPAAVLGEDLDPLLLAEVENLPVTVVVEHLQALTTAGLLVLTGDPQPRYRFAHALMREGIAQSGPAAAAWHRRAAVALQARLGSDAAQAARIAVHWARAGDDVEALRETVRWSRSAAAHALRILAAQDAARLLEQALAALDQVAPGPDERAEILIELARAEYFAGRVPAAIRHLRAAAACAAAADRPDLLTAAALVINGAGDPEILLAAAALCDRALSAVNSTSGKGAGKDPTTTVVARARLTARRACLRVEADLPGDSTSTTLKALRLAERCGDRAALLDATQARSGALDRPEDVAERQRLGEQTVRLGRTTGHPMAAVRGYIGRIDAAYQLVDIATADDEIAQLDELAATTDLTPAHWFRLRVSAARSALAGRFDQARSESESAGALANRMNDPMACAVTDEFTGLLAVIRGDRGELPTITEPTPAWFPQIPVFQAAHAVRLQLLGHRQEALTTYQHLRLQLRQPMRGRRGLGMLHYLTELVEAFNDVEAAGWAHDHWLPWVATGGLPGNAEYFCAGSPARAVGRMAAVLGRLNEAEAALRTATVINTQLNAQPWLTHTWLTLADVLRRRGGPGALTEAVELARRAGTQARRLDQPGPLSRADRLLAELTTQRRLDDPMTAREREVAGLVTQAFSNRQIADRLVLSERTVESHVHNILIKLGVTNRAELIARLLGNPQ